MTAPTHDPAPGRLRWRARRGTRELDRVIGRWLDLRYANASPERRAEFDALLDEADPDLWDWLTGNAVVPARYVTIVDEIRGADRV